MTNQYRKRYASELAAVRITVRRGSSFRYFRNPQAMAAVSAAKRRNDVRLG